MQYCSSCTLFNGGLANGQHVCLFSLKKNDYCYFTFSFEITLSNIRDHSFLRVGGGGGTGGFLKINEIVCMTPQFSLPIFE